MATNASFLEPYLTYWLNPHTTSPTAHVVFFSLHCIIMAIFFYYGYKKIKFARLLLDTPTSKIRSATQGFVELKGQCQALSPLLSPLSHTPCVWWKYDIQEKKYSGNNRHWVSIEKAESPAGFLIKDKTGTCMVHPEGAHIYPHRKRKWYGSTSRPSHGFQRTSCFNKKYRYYEQVLIEALPIFAQGMYHTFTPENLRLDPADLIREWKKDYQSLLKKYDTDRDGTLRPQEWQQVIWNAEKECAIKEKKITFNKEIAPSVHILSSDGLTQDHTFILSGKSEKQLYQRKINGSVLLGIGFMIFFLHNLYAIS